MENNILIAVLGVKLSDGVYLITVIE